jgi:hypothetical protein
MDFFAGNMCFREKTAVIHHCQPMSVLFVAFFGIVGPLPGRMVGIGDLKSQPHQAQHVRNPPGLTADLKQHDGLTCIQFGKQVVKDFRTRANRTILSCQRTAIQITNNTLEFSQIHCYNRFYARYF